MQYDGPTRLITTTTTTVKSTMYWAMAMTPDINL